MAFQEEDMPILSPPELKNITLAQEQTGTLATYLERCIELLQADKKDQARSLLQDNLKRRFNTISNLLTGGQEDLISLSDKAYSLCLDDMDGPRLSNVKEGLRSIKLLDEKLEAIISANKERTSPKKQMPERLEPAVSLKSTPEAVGETEGFLPPMLPAAEPQEEELLTLPTVEPQEMGLPVIPTVEPQEEELPAMPPAEPQEEELPALPAAEPQEMELPVIPTVEPQEEELPALPPDQLQKLVLAAEQTDTMELYLERCVELIQANKKTRAKSLLQEHVRKNFDTLSDLLPGEQGELIQLSDEAYGLCMDNADDPDVANLEEGLQKIRLLKEKLEEIISANQNSSTS
jgi:hypothetical protein